MTKELRERLGFAFAGWAIALAIVFGVAGAPFSRRVDDFALRTRGVDRDPCPFVVAAIDDDLLTRWTGPTAEWGPRYATLADRAFADGAKGVVLDIVTLAGGRGDAALVDSLLKHGPKLVIPFRFDRNGKGRGPSGPLGAAIALRGGPTVGTAATNLPFDRDGVPRHGDVEYGAFASIAAAAANLAGTAPTGGRYRADLIRWRVPVITADRLRPADVKGKVVLVGFTDALSTDFKPMPGEAGERPGVEVQARLAATLWADSALISIGEPLVLGLCALVGAASFGASLRGRVYPALIAVGGGALAFHAWRIGWAIPVVPVVAAALGPAIGGRVSEARRIARQSDRLQSAFATQLSPAALEHLLQHGDRGTELCGTILFFDVRGATQLAAQADPQKTFSLLNNLFGTVLPIVRRHGGIVHGFMGDGFFATFGALSPLDNDAAAAVSAAAEMAEAGAGTLKFGIGLHRGTFLLGNLGDRERAQFTCIGDAINLAARVESATKNRATILATADVYDRAVRFPWSSPMSVEMAGKGLVTVRGLSEFRPKPENLPSEPDVHSMAG